MNKTPLYENHLKSGGKIVDFEGWALPVQYTGIIEEHERTRNAAGLFDVSHMGEIRVTGRDSEPFIQRISTNDISGARDGQVVYSHMCYPDGGVVDDLLVYKYSDKDYLLVVNASNTDKDFEWLEQNLIGQAEVKNVSGSYAQLALQGPKAEAILQKLCEYPLSEIRFFHFKPDMMISGISAIVSRTGYTGEDGFEIYINTEYAPSLWEKILSAGRDDGLVPVGLGARDTLRFEAALPLYGHEISEDISPFEAGLGRFVKCDKGVFIGKEALEMQNETGLKRLLTGFEMTGPGIPRSGCEVFSLGKSVGFVTTGGYSPTLKKSIGLAIVDIAYSAEGTEFDINIRNRQVKAKAVKLPFYTKKYKK
ncbi:MAG: glycine cleavage system aminomethyltransferase GcvT [Eubacteriales bacterium]|nr:glycine cleavage system aminomethyltransferase GcvT [Eubacteriales bacterium]